MDYFIPSPQGITEIHSSVLEISGGKSGVLNEQYVYSAPERVKLYLRWVVLDRPNIEDLSHMLRDLIEKYGELNE